MSADSDIRGIIYYRCIRLPFYGFDHCMSLEGRSKFSAPGPESEDAFSCWLMEYLGTAGDAAYTKAEGAYIWMVRWQCGRLLPVRTIPEDGSLAMIGQVGEGLSTSIATTGDTG